MVMKYKGIVHDPRFGGKTKKCYPLYCEHCDEEFMVKAVSAPKKRKHTCGKYATQRCSGYAWTQKSDDQVRRKVERFNHEGYNKDQADQFYKSSIEGIENRIQGVGGSAHYKAVVPDMDYMVKTGQAKPMSEPEIQKAEKVRKDLVVKHTGGKKNFNVGRSNNSQSSK
jgi:hypothetical protein